jgi:hypothetical protein
LIDREAFKGQTLGEFLGPLSSFGVAHIVKTELTTPS